MTENSNISIFIIEDEVVVAMDIARRLKKLGYAVANVKHDYDDAIRFLDIHTPDLILCDINIDGSRDGIELAMHNQSNKRIPLIFITALSDRPTLERAKKSLPYGYIVKPFNNRDLLTAIELALYKHQIDLNRMVLTQEKMTTILSAPLSGREFEILEDVVKGMTNTQISESRFISVSTVKFHISNIFQKMDAKNRADALQKLLTLFS